MKQFLKTMLSDDQSVSSTRIMSLWLIILGTIISGVGVYRWAADGEDITDILTLVIAIFSLAVGGKTAQNLAGGGK